MNKIESLKELSSICQKPDYKKVGNWMVRHILRDAALPITWLLLHTPATANQVTLASLVIGLVGIALFAVQSKAAFVVGVLLLQLWYLLDHVDGQIARYHKTACLSGRFFDFITHHIIHGVIFFSLGVYCFRLTAQFYFIFWGFLTSASMFLFNLINDTKYKTFFEKLMTGKNISIRTQEKFLETQKHLSAVRKIFSIMHKISEIHVCMNIISLAAILEIIFSPLHTLRLFLFLAYGLIVPSIAIVKVSYLIVGRKIDEEFIRTFTLDPSPELKGSKEPLPF